MMTLTKKEGALTPLRREMERLFDDFGRMSWPAWMEKEGPLVPAVEVGETDEEFFVKAQVPGLKRDDLDVQLTDGALTLKGEAKKEKEESEGNICKVNDHLYLVSAEPGADQLCDGGKLACRRRIC